MQHAGEKAGDLDTDLAMDQELENKLAIVSGPTGGIELGIAEL